ncbi:uncharacterized protein [Miscanthus floridulus]|uniref:uncharacterized protein isoform X3 n=1 Tax=Miscanthus floridulus TaxID=154761 RepID=UPI003458D22E
MPVRPSSRHSCGLLGSVEPDEIQPQLSQPWLLQCWWRTVIGEGGHGGFAEEPGRLQLASSTCLCGRSISGRSVVSNDRAFALSPHCSLGFDISTAQAGQLRELHERGGGDDHRSLPPLPQMMCMPDKAPDTHPKVIGWSWSIRYLITQKGLFLREHTTERVVFERAHNRGSRFHYVKTRGCHLHWVETSTPDPRKRGAQGDSRTSIRRKVARINSPTTHEYLLTGVDIEVGQSVPQPECRSRALAIKAASSIYSPSKHAPTVLIKTHFTT